jgi:hypothetical protein
MFRFVLKAVIVYRHKSVRNHKHFIHQTLVIKNGRCYLSLADIRVGMFYILAETVLEI